jgi:hypothetical protein
MRSSVRSTDGRTFWMSATLRHQRASKAETCLSALHKIQCNQTTENFASTHSHANSKQTTIKQPTPSLAIGMHADWSNDDAPNKAPE